jgi:hypothetical protein
MRLSTNPTRGERKMNAKTKAWAVYEQAAAAARAEYQRSTAPARAEYERASASALRRLVPQV